MPDKPPKRPRASPPTRCAVPECDRPAYAKGLCQTHHRQMLTTGRVKPIRPYRKRSAGTVKFAGFRLSADCASKIQQKADREDMSRCAAIADILEDWIDRSGLRTPGKRPRAPRKH